MTTTGARRRPVPAGGPGGAAWGTIAAGIVQLVLGALVAGTMYVGFFVANAEQDPWEDTELPPGWTPEAMSWVLVVGFGLFAATGTFMIAGGISALRRRRWWLALAGAFAAIGFNGMFLCPIGPAFGIWLVVLLLRQDVRESFADQERPASIEEDPTPWR